MPNATHQTDSRLSPNSPCTLAKGEPLSLRIAWGNPCRSKSRSKLCRTVSVRALLQRTQFQDITAILVAHRQRFAPPSQLLHQPLKSTVHTSLGVALLAAHCTIAPLRSSAAPPPLLCQPCPLQHPLETCSRWPLPHAGANTVLGSCAAPKLGCASFRRTISHTSSSGSCSGLALGPPRLLLHSLQAFAQKTLLPFVACLGTDPIFLAQAPEN